MKALTKISELFAILAGWSLFFLALLVTAEVLSRKLFSFSLQSADEFGGYILAISSAAGFSVALVNRNHTRVDLLWQHLPQVPRAVLNVLAYLTLAVFAATMAWYAWGTLSQSYNIGSRAFTPLQTPLWIPQALWFGALAIFAATAIGMTLRAVVASLRDPAEANRTMGPPHSAEAEIELASSEQASITSITETT